MGDLGEFYAAPPDGFPARTRVRQPQRALGIINGALYLDPRSAPAQTVYFDALRKVRGEP